MREVDSKKENFEVKQQVGKGRTGKESMAQSRDPVSHTSIYLGSLQARQTVSTGINKAMILSRR